MLGLSKRCAIAVIACLVFALPSGGPGATNDEQPIPEFTEAILNDPDMLALGKTIWQEQCRHCHGKDSYPGKAPKLKPQTYTPQFVYHRVTYGFRGMPAWKDVYDERERMAVVAWVLSPQFSP